MSNFSKIYVALLAASDIVAFVRLMNDDVAIIIGAMIIAPL